jgi:hypothetical protein
MDGEGYDGIDIATDCIKVTKSAGIEAAVSLVLLLVLALMWAATLQQLLIAQLAAGGLAVGSFRP